MFNTRMTITGVDIGTSHVRVAIGASDGGGKITVLGHGEKTLRPASGSSPGAVCKGEIVEMPEVAAAVSSCIAAAEDDAGCKIDRNNLFISVTGAHVRSMQGRGVAHIRGQERKVTDEDIDNAMKGAENINLPPDLFIINGFDSYYILDDGDRRVPNPVGQIANKLEAFTHIIYGDANRINTTLNALHDAGYDNDAECVFSIIADSFGVLRESQKDEGVLLINIGAGTTEYLLIMHGCISASGILPIGTEHIANDIHAAFGLTIEESRKVMLQRELFDSAQSKHAVLTVAAKEGRRNETHIPIHSIEKVIEARVSELVILVQESLKQKYDRQPLRVPVVLTGGGALLPYILDYMTRIIDVPVNIGKPIHLNNPPAKFDSPLYATVAGLLIYGDFARRTHRPGFLDRLPNRIYDMGKGTFDFFRDILKGGDR